MRLRHGMMKKMMMTNNHHIEHNLMSWTRLALFQIFSSKNLDSKKKL